MRNSKLPKILLLSVLFSSLVGCDITTNNAGNGDSVVSEETGSLNASESSNEASASKVSAADNRGISWIIGEPYAPDTKSAPYVDEYDSGMSKAHFISAPDWIDERAAERATEYEASFRMLIGGTEASFVLGDARGEYGRLALYGIRATAAGEYFTFRSFEGGVEDGSYRLEIPIGKANDDTIAGRVYSVNIKVAGDKAQIFVDDNSLGEISVPEFGLGCVGTYKSRGTDVASVDDIVVTAGGKELFAEDFDGNFVNNLHENDYANPKESAFSPFYYKTNYDTKGRSLVVSSGFLLSETDSDAAPVFKREFNVDKASVESAYLYMTALGSFDASINGQAVSEHFFDPGKMVFDQYLSYVSYDVTELIADTNELEIGLFHGFFDRGVGYPEVASPWGDKLAVKGELVINYRDGSREIIPTDESFLVSKESRYRFNDIYQGEIIDDRYDITEAEDFQAPLVDVVEDKFLNVACRHKENDSISVWNRLNVVSVKEPEPGHFVYDFGQNVAGTIRIDKDLLCDAAMLKDGDVLTFRFGEFLNDNNLVNSDDVTGTVWTRGLLSARNTDYYVYGAKASQKDICFSHTYHGFRYMEVTGLEVAIPEEAITALALSSGMEQTGEFHCSNETINALYQNSVYSLRSNLMDNPTDCAQRDERLGWSGDAQAVSGFAMYQYDSEAFYRNYLRELRVQQEENGAISDVTPRRNPFGGHSCWGDSITQITWNAYLQYGDETIIAENVDAAERWVNYLVATADDFLLSSGGYGDHLSGQSTPETLTDTAWAAHSARLVANMHRVREDEALTEIYDGYADEFTRKWQETFIREDGSVAAGILNSDVESETAYALGIAFDLFPEGMKQDAAERLNILSEYGAYLFYPGYAGMANYLPALSQNGYVDTAIKVMTNEAPGGLAHPLSLGLTTNPEDLMAFRYQDSAGNDYPGDQYELTGSLNHAAYSSVCAFCYSDILGIRPDENAPGYEHFFVKPMMGLGVSKAEGAYKSRRGIIRVSWDSEARQITCTVPEGTTCTLTLPTGEEKELEAGRHEINW